MIHKLGVKYKTRLNLALKVFSQSLSGKLSIDNILTNEGRSLYIHDYAQISA